jgi:hypothetical protein
MFELPLIFTTDDVTADDLYRQENVFATGPASLRLADGEPL